MILTIIFVFVLLETSLCISGLSNRDIENTPEILFYPPIEPKIDHKLSKRASFRYLSDMYKYGVAKVNGDTRTKREILSNMKTMKESYAVIAFIDSKVEKSSEEMGKNRTRLIFHKPENVSSKTIIEVELRVFQKGIDICEKVCNNFSVIVYKTLDSNEQQLQYVSSLNTTGNYTGWLSFNITYLSEIFDSDEKLYLMICPTPNKEDGHSGKPTKLPTISEDEETLPFLVVYMRKVENLQILERSDIQDQIMKRHPSQLNTKKSGNCQLHHKFVDFKDLGWKDWIVAPQGFNINYCAGDCSFFSLKNETSSNHAIIQNLMHLLDPYRIPKPCCVPSRLESMFILYIASSGKIIYKNFEDIIAADCKCA